jgi:hypothetical protein
LLTLNLATWFRRRLGQVDYLVPKTNVLGVSEPEVVFTVQPGAKVWVRPAQYRFGARSQLEEIHVQPHQFAGGE